MLVIVTLGLSACSSATKVETKYVEQVSPVCNVLKNPVNKHMRTIVKNGEKILGVGADAVIVTGTELSDVYVASCDK